MSGGSFDYDQYRIKNIAESIQSEIDKSGKPKRKEDLWHEPEWYEKYPEDLLYHKWPPKVIEKMEEAVELLNRAHIYAHRIDYLLAGDDSEETFLERLEKDLENEES